MNEITPFRVEQVADVPLLLALTQQMGLANLLDQHFPTHGLWQGLSLGAVGCGWLAFILSQADHRLSQVEEWAESLLFTLQTGLGQDLRSLDFNDDRLARLLKALSNDARWQAFEVALNANLLRVYQLPARTIRLDTTSASGYWQINEEGLFQLGHSKDHRPDLPQFKIMLATLDPLGLPLAVEVVSGNKADDPLYCPIIQKVQASLGAGSHLYVGDCKMAALGTRAALQASHDFYLCPLSAVQVSPTQLEAYLQPWRQGQLHSQEVVRNGEPIALGFEREEVVRAEVGGQKLEWTERRLVVRSLKAASSGAKALRERSTKAVQALQKLFEGGRGKRSLTKAPLAEVEQAIETVVQRYGVSGLVEVAIEQSHLQREVRGYGKRAAEVRSEQQLQIKVEIKEEALQEAEQKLGWRVYVTNGPAEELSLEEAVLAYREEYLVERCFGRLKGAGLALRPLYLAREEHIVGLVRLLSVGLRVLVLLEEVVRQRLKEAGEELSGLYAGNPKRRTPRPTSEQLLGAFKRLHLVIFSAEQHTLTALTPLQERILSLLGWGPELYTRLST